MRVLALALGLLNVSFAYGQETHASEAEARALFETGSRAVEAGDLEDGIENLEASLALVPYLPTAYNLAVAHARAGNAVRAAELIHLIREGRFGDLNEAQQTDARSLAADLAPQVATIEVVVRGAEEPWLRVDEGEATSLAERDRLWLEPGFHRLNIGAEGFRPHRVGLRVAAGSDQTIRVDLLASPQGNLIVVAPQPTDRVEIMGVADGLGRIERTVPVGVYEVGLTDAPASRRSVSVERDRTQEVQLRLPEDPGPRRRRLAAGVSIAVILLGAVAIGVATSRSGGGPENDPVFGTIEALSTP